MICEHFKVSGAQHESRVNASTFFPTALEPGEIVPFGYQYQSDELEPGEIRPYTVTAVSQKF